jgi:hypothetical protein
MDPAGKPCIDSSKDRPGISSAFPGRPCTSHRREGKFMELKNVTWNEQAREKILLDADRALQEAVREAASSLPNADKDEVYKFLFEQLKDQFVDFQPGPDLTKYAEAVANGEISSDGAGGNGT